MDQVSRPMQVLLLVAVAFAVLWFVALRPKPGGSGGGGGGGGSAASAPAKPAAGSRTQPKSALPGGLGSAVDKARQAKTQGDADAATRGARADAAAGDPDPATVQTTAAAPATAKPARPAHPARTAAPRRIAGGGSTVNVKVAHSLARGHAVVLLFYSVRGSDDRAVRSEVAAVGRRGGRVDVWSVPVRRLSRFKVVLGDLQILQTPSVVVLGRGREPVLFAGYTDRAQIDQAAALAVKR